MTTASVGAALVVLAAVLVGVAIPVLIQLRATLRTMEKTIGRSGARLDEAMSATTAAAGRIDALVERLEAAGRIEQLFDGVAAAGRVVNQLRDTARVAAAVGAALSPAVASAVHAWREDRKVTPDPSPTVEATEPGGMEPRTSRPLPSGERR